MMYMTMPQTNNHINFRVTDEEKQILQQYCEQTGRQQSDVLREFVRSLKRKLKSPTHASHS